MPELLVHITKIIDVYFSKDTKEGDLMKKKKYLAMPEFGGKDVIQSFTRDQLVQKNVVIFTASSDPPVLEQMKNTGVKEIFKKPFSLEPLTELIEKYRSATT